MKTTIETVFSIYQQQYPLLLRRAVSILGNLEDAEEALQDVAVTLMDQGTALAKVNNLPAYLSTLLRNRAIDLRRKKHADKSVSIETVDSSRLSSPEQEFTRIEQRELIDTLLAPYPEQLREAFVLHVIDGYAIGEVAARLGIKANTLSQRLRRMKLTIAQQWLLCILLRILLG